MKARFSERQDHHFCYCWVLKAVWIPGDRRNRGAADHVRPGVEDPDRSEPRCAPLGNHEHFLQRRKVSHGLCVSRYADLDLGHTDVLVH